MSREFVKHTVNLTLKAMDALSRAARLNEHTRTDTITGPSRSMPSCATRWPWARSCAWWTRKRVRARGSGFCEMTKRANRGSYPRIHNLSGLERSYEQFVDQLQEAHGLKIAELREEIARLEGKVRDLGQEIVYLQSLLAGATDHYTPSRGDDDDV